MVIESVGPYVVRDWGHVEFLCLLVHLCFIFFEQGVDRSQVSDLCLVLRSKSKRITNGGIHPALHEIVNDSHLPPVLSCHQWGVVELACAAA